MLGFGPQGTIPQSSLPDAGGGPEFDATMAASVAVNADFVADHGVVVAVSASVSVVASIAADHGVAGTIAATITPALAVAADHGVAGTIAATVAPVAAFVGTHDISGTIAATVVPVAAVVAIHGENGTLNAVVSINCDMTGSHGDVTGTIAAVVPLVVAIDANTGPMVTIAATVPLVAAIAASHGVVGTITATISPTCSMTGTHGRLGPLAAVVTINATMTGVHGVAGQLAAVVDVFADMIGTGAILDPILADIQGTVRVVADIVGERVFSRIHPRKRIRDAVAAAMVNRTAATDQVFKNRFLPWFPKRFPAVAVYTLDTSTVSGSEETAPRILEHRVEIVVQAAVAVGVDVDPNDPDPPTADDRLDDLCAEIEAVMASDTLLGHTAGDSWLMGTSVEEYDLGDQSYAVATLTFPAFYERGYPNQDDDDRLAIDEFRRASVSYRANGVDADDETADLIEVR